MKKSKHICFMLPDLGSGGAQRVVCNLANYFYEIGFNVSIFCFHSDDINCFYKLKDGILLINLPQGYKRKRRNVIKCAIAARKVFNAIRPDLVIPFLMPVNLYAFFATRFSKIKIIVSERNDPNSMIRYWEWKYLRNFVFRHADGCVFQTVEARDYFGEKVLKKSKIINNPTTLIRDKIDLPPQVKREKRVICIGRYDPQKNHMMLIEAFADFSNIHPEYTLEIYGRDFHNYQKVMEDKISLLGMDKNIRLMGPHKDIFEQIKYSAMSVLTSDYEGMPNALIETMALGIPSIATDCPIGGPRIMIINGVNGFLIPMGDKDTLVKKMCFLVDNPIEAEQMARKAMESVKKYDLKMIGAEWEQFIKETTGLEHD